jgi:hypothetical protein
MTGFPFADCPPEDRQPHAYQCWLHRHSGDEPCPECAWMRHKAEIAATRSDLWRQGAARD